jgi:hypothetical protein
LHGTQESDKLIAMAHEEAEKHKQLAQWAQAPQTKEEMQELQVPVICQHLH